VRNPSVLYLGREDICTDNYDRLRDDMTHNTSCSTGPTADLYIMWSMTLIDSE